MECLNVPGTVLGTLQVLNWFNLKRAQAGGLRESAILFYLEMRKVRHGVSVIYCYAINDHKLYGLKHEHLHVTFVAEQGIV